VISDKGRQTMEESGLTEFLGKENVLSTLELEKARILKLVEELELEKKNKSRIKHK